MKRGCIQLQYVLASFIWLGLGGGIAGLLWFLMVWSHGNAAPIIYICGLFVVACLGGFIATLVFGCADNAKPLCCTQANDEEKDLLLGK